MAHTVDDEVNAKLSGSDAAGKFFAPGKYIGAVYTQAGVAVGLYAIGRYMLPHVEGGPKTNKVSHLGFDMLRAVLIFSQALTQAIKVTAQRDRPTGECCSFPSGHSSATFATAAVLNGTSAIATRGRRTCSPHTWGCLTPRQPSLSERRHLWCRPWGFSGLDGGRATRAIRVMRSCPCRCGAA